MLYVYVCCVFYAPTDGNSDEDLVYTSDNSHSVSSGHDSCNFDEDKDAGAVPRISTTVPNHPVVVAMVKDRVAARLMGVAAAQCFVCDRIIHTLKVKRFDPARYKPRKQHKEVSAELVKSKLDSLVTTAGRYELCGTCYSSVTKGKTPSLAVDNGFRYPAVPDHLPELTEVAEHILAPRIPFQQITNLGRMGRRGQYGLRGSVINIPTEPGETVKQVVPLMPRDDQLYVVNLKRRLVHKRPYASSYVSKEALQLWGEYLSDSELYHKYGVTFDPVRVHEVPDVSDDPGEPDNQVHDGQAQHSILMADGAPPAPSSSRRADTTDDIDVAPGEDRQPLSIVWDREAEELSFPSIYLGQPRTFKTRVTRFQAMTSEVRRVDRRGARPQALLYKYAVHCREQAARRLRHR